MIETLFVHKVDVLRPGMVEDTYGDLVPGWPTSATSRERGWIAQNSADENRSNRTAEIGDWTLFVGPDVSIDGNCRVQWADPTIKAVRTFEVVGPPTPGHTPKGPHHIEVPLREVQG